jgi:DNA-binding transcriptional regulator YiaG
MADDSNAELLLEVKAHLHRLVAEYSQACLTHDQARIALVREEIEALRRKYLPSQPPIW